MCLFSERGKTVPVVGYDDVREKIPLPAAIPSVGSDKWSIAEIAVEMLLARIPGENGRGRVETNAEKIHREEKFDVWLSIPEKRRENGKSAKK